MDIETLEGIRKCPLFEGLTDNEIIDLMHAVRYRVVLLYKSDFLFVAGEDCLQANILIDGEVVANLEGTSDRYIRMSTFHAGDMFAPAFLFAQNRRYPVTVQATTNTKVLRILSADFERLLELDSRLYKNFTVILSNLIAGLTKKVGMLLSSVRDKIIFFLKEQQRLQKSNTITLPMSRQELADYFGIQKYSLQRALNELQESGAIRIDGKIIELLKL
ncbi:MAG: Crp/Fnr family transcriptional regulator [Prevotella sp.]|nr:Crp/Fnr family transcriptional regulator [Prevotella sp.]